MDREKKCEFEKVYEFITSGLKDLTRDGESTLLALLTCAAELYICKCSNGDKKKFLKLAEGIFLLRSKEKEE